jgi:hypothetical protein
MKKEEAMAFIRAELEKEVSDSEIIETLMQQEKIGNNHPALEFVTDLLELAKKEISDMQNEAVSKENTLPKKDVKNDDPPKRVERKSAIYEKWQVDIKTNEKIKKEKNVSLSEAQAERLNASSMTCEKGYKIKYIKK